MSPFTHSTGRPHHIDGCVFLLHAGHGAPACQPTPPAPAWSIHAYEKRLCTKPLRCLFCLAPTCDPSQRPELSGDPIHRYTSAIRSQPRGLLFRKQSSDTGAHKSRKRYAKSNSRSHRSPQKLVAAAPTCSFLATVAVVVVDDIYHVPRSVSLSCHFTASTRSTHAVCNPRSTFHALPLPPPGTIDFSVHTAPVLWLGAA
jgi:hypothetical protein